MSEETKKSWRPSVELVVALALGLLTIGSLAWQVRTVEVHSTATETFLFNTLQLILASGTAWFSTRAISRIEFEQSLKKFAISAYRRVADIERMIDRLHQEVGEMISTAPKPETLNLRIVEAIVSDTGQLVRSSISDWGDVIGDELLAIERIRRLEQEKQRLRNDEDAPSARPRPEISAALQKIEENIEALQRTLPPRLQLETEVEDRLIVSARRAAEWIAREHRNQGGLRMTVVTGDIYLSERDRKTLESGELLFTEKDKEGGLDVRDTDGYGIGRLLNLFPFSYDDFVRAMERCYGAGPLSLEFVELSGDKREKDAFYAWMDVRVKSQPLQTAVGNPRRPGEVPPAEA